jgi:glycine betaine/choline ABC-type transport system substrate-binding protein
VLKQQPSADPGQVYDGVRQGTAKFNLTSAQLLLNDTFAIEIRGGREQLGLKTISQARPTREMAARFGYELMERADGYSDSSRRMGFTSRKNRELWIRPVDSRAKGQTGRSHRGKHN